METLNIQLKEIRNYELIPFGKFKIKWKASDRLNQKLGILALNDISFNYDEGMPCDGEEEKAVIKYMLKHKTDVLVNVNHSTFYTRIGKGFTKIRHEKLSKYNTFLYYGNLKDTPETWEKYLTENGEEY